jgi:hypothetical protein
VRRWMLGGIAVLAALGTVALTGHDRVALAQTCVQYDATGTWQTSQGNAYHPTFSFSQSGTSMSGSATLPADEATRAGFASNTGGVTGSLRGDRLDVTVSWQKADGGGVSGRYTASVEQSGPGTGRLLGGDAGGSSWTGGGPLQCVQTSGPPPTDTTSTPPPNFGTQPNTRVVDAPDPGEINQISSPQTVPAGTHTGTVGVTSSDGQAPRGAVVAEGDTQRRARQQGEAVAACWLIGPGVIKFNNAAVARKLKSDAFLQKWNQLGAHDSLRLCMLIVAIAGDEESNDVPLATTTGSSCKARPLTFTIKKRGKKTTSIRLSTKKPSKGNLRYTCTGSGGQLTIKAKRDAKGGLRKAIGKHLDMGAYRTPNAPETDQRLAFRFKFPG